MKASPLAVGILVAIDWNNAAGSKDEFPSLNSFYKNVDTKLLAKFSQLIASKNISTDKATTLFKGVKPENVAKAMKKIIALSGDPAWKKNPQTRRKELLELKQLLPSLSDKSTHYVPDHLSGIATLVNVKADIWTMSVSERNHNDDNNDGYICEVKIDIKPNFPTLDRILLYQPEIKTNTILKGTAKIYLYGESLKNKDRVPVRLKIWRRKRILKPFLKHNLKQKPNVIQGLISLSTELEIYENGNLIVRPECKIKNKWFDAHQIINNHSARPAYIIHSMTTPIGVQIQAKPFDHERPSWPRRQPR